MWLATTQGFYSIVKHKHQADAFMVRARVEGDLLNLKALAGLTEAVIATPDADYPFRLILSGAQVQELMERLAEGIDYPNFKDRIARSADQRPKLHAYHQVWATMRRLE